MIPATVHYLDLSAGAEGRFRAKRLEELKKVLPGYEFIGWDRQALQKEGLPPEIERALSSSEEQKASSYVCARILMRYGGVFMNPSTVLFHNLSNMSPVGLYCFREYRPERFSENASLLNDYGNALTEGSIPGSGISTAMMASEKDHPLLRRYTQFFMDNLRSILRDRFLTASDLWAMALRGWGLRYLDELQVLYYGVLVYPSEYLPSDPGRLSPLSLGLSLGGDPWESRGKIAGIMSRRKAVKAAAEHVKNLGETEVPSPVMPLLPEENKEEEQEADRAEKFFREMDDPGQTTEEVSSPEGEEEKDM